MQVTLTLRRVTQKGYITFEAPTDPETRQALSNLLLTCKHKHNDYVSVKFEPPYKPRTTGARSQNHHLNGHIVQICNLTGNDYDAIKYCVKMIAVEQMGYPYTEVSGHILPKAEKNCNTEECAKLIEAAHILAAQMGIVLKETEV